MSKPEQLVFDLGRRTAMGRGDFIVSGSNALALRQLEGWRDWPGCKLALVGPDGAGKTHLAHVFAAMTGADVLSAEEISAPLPLEARALVVEDLDRLSPDRRAEVEERVFHLHNALAARSAPLLFTGRTPPAQWRVELPDLASRLSAASVARIEPPDDALLEALLRKHFKDRQLAVADDAIEFLLMRMERSFAAADALAGMIDTAALKEGRDITRRFVADLLREAEGSSL